jgi:branched-chain amino acid transport system permease protein
MLMSIQVDRAPIVRATLDALTVFVLALIVLGPISGMVLDGFGFQGHPLRPLALALVVAAGRFLMTAALGTGAGASLVGRFNAATASSVKVMAPQRALRTPWVLALVALGALVPFLADKYWLSVATLALIYVLLGLGLNIVVGLAGLLDLGFVAFYAVGAYFLAIGAEHFGIGFWSALALAPLLAAICGAVLAFPVLRMHGDYLAIVTLGFGEIIRLVLINAVDVTGGPNGLPAPEPTLLGIEFGRVARQGGVPLHELLGLGYSPNGKYLFLYGVLFCVVLAAIHVVTRLRVMPLGRTWEALREDEIACRSLGINHVMVKLSAFMLSASFGGLAGVFFATQQGFVSPTSFTFFESVLVLSIVVLGGLGSTVGVVLAAIVLTLLPELLRDFAEFRTLVFGALMVVMMLWRPRGLIRPARPAFSSSMTVVAK